MQNKKSKQMEISNCTDHCRSAHSSLSKSLTADKFQGNVREIGDWSGKVQKNLKKSVKN